MALASAHRSDQRSPHVAALRASWRSLGALVLRCRCSTALPAPGSSLHLADFYVSLRRQVALLRDAGAGAST